MDAKTSPKRRTKSSSDIVKKKPSENEKRKRKEEEVEEEEVEEVELGDIDEDEESPKKRVKKIDMDETNKLLIQSICSILRNIIYVDPPWFYHNGMKTKGAAHHHYKTIPTKELQKLDIPSIAAKDCALILWTTGPHMKTAIGLMEAWGFKYAGILHVWVKRIKGEIKCRFQGHYTAQVTEYVLLGTIGNIQKYMKQDFPRDVNVFMEDVMEHSRKPSYVRDHIDKVFLDVPRIELFARESNSIKWDFWGNEVKKFGSIVFEKNPRTKIDQIRKAQQKTVKEIDKKNRISKETKGEIRRGERKKKEEEGAKKELGRKQKRILKELCNDLNNLLLEYNQDCKRNLIHMDPENLLKRVAPLIDFETDIYDLLKRLRIDLISNSDCILAIWTTGANMKHSTDLIERWGFNYITMLYVNVNSSDRQITAFQGISKNSDSQLYTMDSAKYILLASRGLVEKYKNLHFERQPNVLFSEVTRKNSKILDYLNVRKNGLDKFFANVPRLELFIPKYSEYGLGSNSDENWDSFDGSLLTGTKSSKSQPIDKNNKVEIERMKIRAMQMKLASNLQKLKMDSNWSKLVDPANKYGLERNNQTSLDRFWDGSEKK
jgi:N6-adenosine-specific RNA methylase IME4